MRIKSELGWPQKDTKRHKKQKCFFVFIFVAFRVSSWPSPLPFYRKTLSESSGSFRKPTLRTVLQGMMVTE
jgi:hypothetical protein